ncbi:MAG TPA: adenylosuccinate synthetase [Terriglobales bacterium]|nr:adenylosuccinate synthetase [Terriglobales bacterium]
MPFQIVLLSGPVASGKTTLWQQLTLNFPNEQIHVLKTKDVIRELALKKLGHELPSERRALQDFGEQLDRDTGGHWVRDALISLVNVHLSVEVAPIFVVDAVRILPQIKAIREAFGFAVKHIHLKAPEHELAQRYKHRSSDMQELRSFKDVEKNPTEAAVHELEKSADIVVDTQACTPDDVLVKTATHLGLFAREYARLVDVIVGGQYGSEGKGHIASYLSREYAVLVRVGGPNAGHKVYLKPGPYVHHQLPSGTLRNPAAKLIIAPGAVVNPDSLLKEIRECKVDHERLSIDPQTMIIAENDCKSEAGLQARISSTGQGVGVATARRILNRGKRVKLAKDVLELRPFIRDTWELLERTYNCGGRVLVEGTQGTGLSLFHGSYPYVTSRDTTVSGCLSEAGISPSRVRKTIMVCRTYPIRVQNPSNGTSGPLRQELDWDEIARRAEVPAKEIKTNERTSTTNRERRVGAFDWVLLRKSSALNAPTDIAITFADYLNPSNAVARRYEQLSSDTIRFIEEVERVGAAPVSLISTRFDFRSIIDRRTWRM